MIPSFYQPPGRSQPALLAQIVWHQGHQETLAPLRPLLRVAHLRKSQGLSFQRLCWIVSTPLMQFCNMDIIILVNLWLWLIWLLIWIYDTRWYKNIDESMVNIWFRMVMWETAIKLPFGEFLESYLQCLMINVGWLQKYNVYTTYV